MATNNAILLINSIFQEPASNGDYTLLEGGGISSVRFTGTASSVTYDVNNANVPVGGVIISVGSSAGFGYQPLVSAGGTELLFPLQEQLHQFQLKYWFWIQKWNQTVNVGVGTSSTGTANIEFIGTAAISGGHIVSVAITNPGAGYTTTNPPYVSLMHL